MSDTDKQPMVSRGIVKDEMPLAILFAFVVSVTLNIVLGVFICNNTFTSTTDFQDHAVNRGYAEWVYIEGSGRRAFRWKAQK